MDGDGAVERRDRRNRPDLTRIERGGGFAAVEGPVSVADWHATILHLLGLHHEELFFERSGFKEKLTGVEKARVIREILA